MQTIIFYLYTSIRKIFTKAIQDNKKGKGNIDRLERNEHIKLILK